MSRKINVLEIARAQLSTFQGYARRTLLGDLATFLGLPVAVGIAAAFFAPPVHSVGGLLTGASVFSGLLVALLVNIFNFSVKVRRDEKVRPEEKLARTVDELLTNAAWTVLVGLTLVVLLAVASATQEPSKPLDQVWVGTLAGFSAYLVLNILMVLSRIWTAHEDIKDLPPKK
ncbi:hypothetical protein ACFVTM_03985 [Arthrobacter sp. NPDC058130]|uniref:hypothetical protein n=1 Tax=Arthrobacter sp. NPDC058130 TaxID=3346353 RepID=UPI0036E0360F